MAILFTGFPGFLGSELLPRVLRRSSDEALCIVQPKFHALAEQRVREIEAREAQLRGRIRLVDGDITRPLAAVNASEVREIWHLAAVYDLAVKRDLAMKVNVDGTRNVLDLAERSPRLERLHYVSTCYVSGRHPGVFGEEELAKGQSFNNYYEETKYLAERDVRQRTSALPTTIYRPSVVVGDSRSGATQKFDGPYFVIQWLMRQPRLALLPTVGNPRNYRFNVVPRDFVVDAMETLSAMPETIGRCFALADPDPLTVDETIETIASVTGRRVIRIPLTLGLAKASLDYVPGVYRLMRIPSAAVNYFVHPTLYDTSNADAALERAGLRVPRFPEYAPRLVDFVRAHPEIGSAAMV